MSTPQQLADRAEGALKELDAVFREASAMAGNLDPQGAAEFRALRRKYARFHADCGDFVETYVPDVTIQSGGT